MREYVGAEVSLWGAFIMQRRYWLPEYGMLIGVDVLAKAGFTRKLPGHIKFICLAPSQS